MIELCPSSGVKVDSDSMFRCVCGRFWYGKDYPETDGHKRNIVEEVPWHNEKGHIIDRDKWEKRNAERVEVQKRIDEEREKNSWKIYGNNTYIASNLRDQPRGVTLTK